MYPLPQYPTRHTHIHTQTTTTTTNKEQTCHKKAKQKTQTKNPRKRNQSPIQGRNRSLTLFLLLVSKSSAGVALARFFRPELGCSELSSAQAVPPAFTDTPFLLCDPLGLGSGVGDLDMSHLPVAFLSLTDAPLAVSSRAMSSDKLLSEEHSSTVGEAIVESPRVRTHTDTVLCLKL